MAQLAIKGHATRGNEVIEILEMLGGKMKGLIIGNDAFHGYYINTSGDIDYKHYSLFDDAIIFTLEEFLEKFPYKVWDKVTLDKFPCEIKGMSWEYDDIIYYVEGADFSKGVYSKDKDLQPYKEETMEEIKVDIPKGYEFAGVDDNAQQVVFTKIAYHYPRTYEECCKILGVPSSFELRNQTIQAWYIVRLSFFQQLLICRDAYWEIGEQMGLHKPWKPDWENFDSMKYCIRTDKGIVGRCIRTTYNKILAFPTEEMRDAFYENFKELIEECKELL